MKINAYIMVADPAWIENSVLSYYDKVEKIVVSYDENSMSWTGRSLNVEACLKRLRAIDSQGKMVFAPGHYARLDHEPLENDTYQRQCALDQAAQGADWVIQLDTDEVMVDPDEFLSCLQEADEKGYGALNYPARWLYKRIGYRHYLEQCSRIWRTVGSYPGPIAVKGGTQLTFARQTKRPVFYVDFSFGSTDFPSPRQTPAHRVIRPDQAIMHYSMVRSEKELRHKLRSSGHANERDWNPEIKNWFWSGRHPLLAMLITPVVPISGPRQRRRLRISRIAPPIMASSKLRRTSSETSDN